MFAPLYYSKVNNVTVFNCLHLNDTRNASKRSKLVCSNGTRCGGKFSKQC